MAKAGALSREDVLGQDSAEAKGKKGRKRAGAETAVLEIDPGFDEVPVEGDEEVSMESGSVEEAIAALTRGSETRVDMDNADHGDVRPELATDDPHAFGAPRWQGSEEWSAADEGRADSELHAESAGGGGRTNFSGFAQGSVDAVSRAGMGFPEPSGHEARGDAADVDGRLNGYGGEGFQREVLGSEGSADEAASSEQGTAVGSASGRRARFGRGSRGRRRAK
jgi:hypothetical protein